MQFERHIDLAFAIYSKNVPKLGRGKNSDKSKLVKRLRYTWAQFICRCGFRPSTQERLDKLLSTFLFYWNNVQLADFCIRSDKLCRMEYIYLQHKW